MSRILDLFRLTPVDGDVGVEIEVEARLPLPQVNTPVWSTHTDGSLRGYALEYVTKPIKIKDVPGAIQFLKTAIEPSALKRSVRAGVHVHVNCQQMTNEDLIKYIALYVLFEIPLVNYCGSDRVGNSFCLRMCDAEGAIDTIRSIITRGAERTSLDDNMRYGALNPVSLRKFGTLEFRALGTDPTFENIGPWVNILVRLRDASASYKSLEHILETLETVGLKDFTKNVFGDLYKIFFPEFDEHEVLIGQSYLRELLYFTK